MRVLALFSLGFVGACITSILIVAHPFILSILIAGGLIGSGVTLQIQQLVG